MQYLKTIIIVTIVFFLMGCSGAPSTEPELDTRTQFTIYPIGKVVKEDGHTYIILEKQYLPGLLGLEKFTHLTVVYWFDRNDNPVKRSILQVHPRNDKSNPLTGVFGTHSPVRPNLIAISKCKVLSIKDNIIELEDIDAFDNTPVIDLKGDFFFFYRK